MFTRRRSNLAFPKESETFERLDEMMDGFFGQNSLINNSHIFTDKWFANLKGDTNIARHPIHTISDANGVKIEFDVPGSSKEDLEISYDEKTQNLSVSSKVEKKSSSGLEIRSFTYTYWLGEKYDINTLEASCEKGVLTIMAKALKPKAEEKTKRKINIK